MTLEGFLADLELLKRKYHELQQVAGRQKQLMASGDYRELPQLVERKQKLMAAVEQITARTQQRRQSADEWSQAQRETVNRAVADAEGELREVLRLEEENRRAMESRRDEASGKIKKIGQARRARDLYGGGAAGSRFIDRSE